MNEINVVLMQVPGEVHWNYEEVKKFLAQEMEHYKGLVYDDSSIGDAKKDRALLNKLSKQIDAKRKEAKEKCLEPYQIIEDQAKELKSLIEDPVKAIDEQVKAYEQKKQEQTKEEIGAYFDEVYTESGLSPEIRKKVIMRIWDQKWLNVTTSKKAWKDGVDKGIAEVKDELEQIKGLESEFEADMIASYNSNLSFRDAVQTMHDLDRQKKRVIELERQKKEEEARQAAEAAKPVQEPTPESAETEIKDCIEEPEKKQAKAESPHEARCPEIPGKNVMTLMIAGDSTQLAKIKGYIRYVGASYEELDA